MSRSDRPSRLAFFTALFAAPALLGVAVWAFSLMGEYAGRFSQAGALGLLVVLPAWFTAFAWLAWRDTVQGSIGLKSRVKAGLSANFASLMIFPALVLLASSSGTYMELVQANSGAVGEGEPATPRDAAIATAIVSFLLGLIFMPILAWIFEKVSARIPGRQA